MHRVLLFIAFILFTTVSYGQKKADGLEIYNGDTIRVGQKPNKDSVKATPAVASKDTIKTGPVATIPSTSVPTSAIVAKDTVKTEPPIAAKEVSALQPPVTKKDTVKETVPPAPMPAVNREIPKKTPEQPKKEKTTIAQQITNKDLLGKWQMESTEMADGFYYTYSFLRGNTFVFGNDENEGLNRILSLSGTYYLKSDTLVIYVKQEFDLAGGNPEMSEKQSGSGWEIKGGKIVTRDLPVVKEYNLSIRPCDDKDGKRCLEINSMSYYKME